MTQPSLQSPPPNPKRKLLEDTDLERRVLAHERVLQSLIAYLAAADPGVLERLRENFSHRMRHSHYEQDYTDTDAYADRFIAEIGRIDVSSLRRPEAPAPADATPARASRPTPTEPVPSEATAPPPGAQRGDSLTPFRIRKRQGIWNVTKYGRFFGDFFGRPQADAAVERAGRHSSEAERTDRR